jgi:dUTP pyrophosphatase
MLLTYKRFDTTRPAFSKEGEGNVGYDLFARLEQPLILEPNQVAKVPLNIATEIPFGVVGLVFQRSSTYRKWGVRLTNNVGVIDPSYRGDNDEWCAEVKNETDSIQTINDGDKICQAIFFNIAQVEPSEVLFLGNQDRGGFGTTFDNFATK